MNVKTWIYQKQIKVVILSFIFGFVYALSILLKENAVEKWQAGLRGLGAGVVCFCLLNVCWFLMILDREKWKSDCKKKSYGGRFFLLFFVLLLTAYTICFLTYFPGVGMNDGLNIMYFGMSQAVQHPLFYCSVVVALT